MGQYEGTIYLKNDCLRLASNVFLSAFKTDLKTPRKMKRITAMVAIQTISARSFGDGRPKRFGPIHQKINWKCLNEPFIKKYLPLVLSG